MAGRAGRDHLGDDAALVHATSASARISSPSGDGAWNGRRYGLSPEVFHDRPFNRRSTMPWMMPFSISQRR
jgi:hypothetical protein